MAHEKEDLSGYLDGALTGAERGRIEAHLQDCAECRAELEDLRAVSGLVKGLPQKPLPTGFLQRLETRRSQDRPEGWASLSAPRNLAWAACAVTVMFATYKTAHLYAPMPTQSSAKLDNMSSFAAPQAALPSGPVSTSDLLALSKEQRRAQGIAAMRGSADSASVSAAGLAAPAAPRGFGGMAIGEAPEAGPAYTNEALQKHLETERARLGIRRIVAPNPVVRTLRSAAHGLADDTGQSLDQEAVPAPVAGKAAALLSQGQSPGRSAADGALVPPDDFSGALAGAGGAASPRKALGAPLPAAVGAAEAGQTVYSSEEMTLLWRERGFTAAAPDVDFSQEMLVVVFGQARIESVATAANRIVVSYRSLDSAPRPRQRWRIIPRSELPVVFQPAP
jgi:anti-sigma factor RsiW